MKIAGMVLCAAALAACATTGETLAPAMVDGSCAEYAETERTGGLFLRQDANTVWLCAPTEAGRLLALDLVIEAPALAAPLNLHVSAQLGEWPADGPAPQTANDPAWWNNDGWTASALRFNGYAADGNVNFLAPRGGVELQLSKARFGRGAWRLRAVDPPINAEFRVD